MTRLTRRRFAGLTIYAITGSMISIQGCGGGGGSKESQDQLSSQSESAISSIPTEAKINLTTARLADSRTLQEVIDKFGTIRSVPQTRAESPLTPLDFKAAFIANMIDIANKLTDDSRNVFTDSQGTVYQRGIHYGLGAKDYTIRENYKIHGMSQCTTKIHALDCSGLVTWCARGAGLSGFTLDLSKSTLTAMELGKPKTWNDVIPSSWRLTMEPVSYSDVSELEVGDIVSWPSHIGIVGDIINGDCRIAQSNGVRGDFDGPECSKNVDRQRRGPRYVSLNKMISGTDWKLGQPKVLRLVAEAEFTVELNWGAQPDVDLHVTEPNGAHVFYGATNGQVGFLDVDDLSSFGPEHYFVREGQLQDGNYIIGVNYYRGTGPETAVITITTGTVTKNFTTVLPSALGSAGDRSPKVIATIKVEQTSSGKRQVSIVSSTGRLVGNPFALPSGYVPKD